MLTSVFAQDETPVYNNEEYTLVDDHIFASLYDFYGHTFVPAQGKLAFAHYPDKVPAGWVRFTISRNEITILERTEYRPGGIQVRPNRKKEYKLRITKVEDRGVAVKFSLIDIEYPDLDGHLSLHKDGYGRVTMMRYLPGPGEPERIYIMKYATEEQLAADKEYFTHQEDIKTDDTAPFWGNTLYPFVSYDNYYNLNTIKVNRLRPDDGFNINFFEKTVIVKNDKEKLMQYISFVENSEKKMQLLFKKATEVEVSSRDGKTRKGLELACVDEVTKENYYIIMHRGAHTYLKSIEVQKEKGKSRTTLMYYTMRKGKGTPIVAKEQSEDKTDAKKEEGGLLKNIFSKKKKDKDEAEASSEEETATSEKQD
jgi:hypothetical protein